MSQTIAASYKNWEIVVDVLEDFVSDSVLALLRSDGRVVSSSESFTELLKACPENVAKELRAQLIQREIAELGGIAKYKELVYENQLKYGTNCYDYMDAETLRAYAALGIYLSSKL